MRKKKTANAAFVSLRLISCYTHHISASPTVHKMLLSCVFFELEGLSWGNWTCCYVEDIWPIQNPKPVWLTSSAKQSVNTSRWWPNQTSPGRQPGQWADDMSEQPHTVAHSVGNIHYARYIAHVFYHRCVTTVWECRANTWETNTEPIFLLQLSLIN